MSTMKHLLVLLSILLLVLPTAAGENDEKKGSDVDCELKYNLKGWSAFYKTAKGEGTIRCDNGQTAEVTLRVKGGGITFGKREVVDGRGEFSGVSDISELFGSYAQAGAHAGAAKSAEATVMTKGEVSLALAGTGKGVDLGVDFGKFTIERK